MPIIFFLIYFQKSKKQAGLWLVFAYSIYDFLTNLGLLYLEDRGSKILLYSAFTFVEYILFSAIVFSLIKSKKLRIAIASLSVAFITFLVWYNFNVKVKGIDSIPIGVETLLIIIFSFFFFYEELTNEETDFIYTKASFWVVFGMLFYLGGSLFIYLYSNQLLAEHKDNEVAFYWMFTNIFSILKNIFFTIAIVVNANRSPKKTAGFAMYHLN